LHLEGKAVELMRASALLAATTTDRQTDGHVYVVVEAVCWLNVLRWECQKTACLTTTHCWPSVSCW